MKQLKSSKEVVGNFFEAFGNGDFQGILDTFHPQVKIIAVRDSEVSSNSLFGRYEGAEGLKSMLTGLGNEFNTKAFEVENIIGDGNVAFANGSFAHEIKSTGKLYESTWALMCKVEDDKIIAYNFYEDSKRYYDAKS